MESAYKKIRAAEVRQPLLRGPARLVEAFAVLPAMKRRLPEAKMPFELPAVAGAMAASALTVRLVRGSSRLGAGTARGPQRAAGASSPRSSRSAAPSSRLSRRRAHLDRDVRARRGAREGARALRLPSRRAAAGDDRDRQHPRGACADPPSRRCPHDAGLGALAASTEIFGWMLRHPDAAVSRALAKPGHELQHRLATSEPTPEQLEVADAALRECLRLEHAADTH